MKKGNLCMVTSVKGVVAALLLSAGLLSFASCSDGDGLTEGDPNYFTSSRGQFTATLDNDNSTTLFLLPGSTSGTAIVTYDGDNPLHWVSEKNTNVNVTTYSGNLTIPSAVIGSDGKTYTLTAIGDEAFMGCQALTTLVLPETITSIGEGAFAICRTLTTINIPEGVTEIPVGCFGYCQRLTTIALPSTVTTLSKMAFYGCSGMTSISLPDNLTTIGEMAFFDCNKLTGITIPASVKTIGNKAFGGRDATNRSKISAYHMQGSVPPTLEGTLYEAQEGVEPIIYVPAGAVEVYKSAAGWSSLTIEEE